VEPFTKDACDQLIRGLKAQFEALVAIARHYDGDNSETLNDRLEQGKAAEQRVIDAIESIDALLQGNRL
jgi:hypothetical protein